MQCTDSRTRTRILTHATDINHSGLTDVVGLILGVDADVAFAAVLVGSAPLAYAWVVLLFLLLNDLVDNAGHLEIIGDACKFPLCKLLGANPP